MAKSSASPLRRVRAVGAGRDLRYTAQHKDTSRAPASVQMSYSLYFRRRGIHPDTRLEMAADSR